MTTFLSHGLANTLILYMALFLAYMVVDTVANYFKAWVSLHMGDSTAAEQGFLSWNPLDHVDFLGLVCLLVVGFGWGRRVPVNPLNIHGKNRTFKIIFAQLSDTIAYIGIGVVAILILGFLFGGAIINNISSHFAEGCILSYRGLHAFYPHHSSVHIAVAFIALCALYLSITLGALHFLVNCFYLFMQKYITPYGGDHSEVTLFWVVSIFVMLFLTAPLCRLIMAVIAFISMCITHLLGSL